MATLQERLNKMKAAGAVQNAVMGGGTARAATPPSSAVLEGATLPERLGQMKAAGQAARTAVKTPVMLPTVKKTTFTPPTTNSAWKGPSPQILPTPKTLPSPLDALKRSTLPTPRGDGEDDRQKLEQVRRKINALSSGFEAKGGAWKQSEEAVRQYSLDRAALIGQEAELTRKIAARDKTMPSVSQRVEDTVSGGLKSTGANMVNMIGTLRELGQESRDKQNKTVVEDYARQLEEAQRALDAALEDEKANPGTWTQGDIQSFYNARDDAQRKYDAATKVYSPEVQQGTIRGAYEAADKVQESSAKDIERAKDGLGAFGGMLVDAGASAVQMAGDAAGGALTGSGMIPFTMRAFGGGTQQARQDGADLKDSVAYGVASVAKEIFTEKMFNIALPFSELYGGGGMDDAVKRVIRNAVDKLAATDKGKKALGGLLTMAASGVSEGLEELIGDWMEWQMPRIYGGDVDTAQETLVNSLYDFAVGGLTGLAGGAFSAGRYDTGERPRQQLIEQEVQHVSPATARDMEAGVAEIAGTEQGAEDVQTQKTAPAEGADIGLVPVSETMKESLSTGKNNVIAQTARDIVAFVKRTLGKKGGPERLYMGTLPETATKFVKNQTGVDVSGYQAILPGDAVQHIIKNHGDVLVESARGQKNVLPEDIARIPEILAAPDSVEVMEGVDANGRRTLLFSKQIGDTYYTAQAITDGRHALTTSTLWIKKGKPTDTTHNISVSADPVSNAQSAPPSGFPLDPIIPSPGDGVKGEYAQPSGEVSAPADGDWQSLAQQADDLFPAPPERTQEDVDSLLEQTDAMYAQKGDPSRGDPFIPTERERGVVDDRTPAEKAMVEEHQRRKAAQPASTEPTYRMTPAMEKLGMEAPSRPITDAGVSESLRENSRALYEAKKQLDKVLRDTHADERARRVAKGIVDGIYTFEDAKKMGLNEKAMVDIASAMQLVRSYNAKGIKAHQERTNWAFDSRIMRLINGSDTWTPPSVRSLNFNTMQRNVERMMPPAVARAVNTELFDPVLENEAKRIRFANRQLDKVRGFNLTTQESAMVQKVMEGKITEAELRGLGLRVETIYKAADTITQMYADFYDAINDFLVAHGYEEIGWQRNYAPHQQMENLTKLQKYLQRLGFSVEVTELPTEIAGRTDVFKPGKMYDPFFQHRAGGEGDIKYDAVGGLESYVNYMSNVLYHTDDIQKLRRFNEALRSKYAEGYIRDELDRLNDLQERLIAGEDVQESWEGVQAQKDKFYEELAKKSKLGGFVSVLDDYTNILAGKQSKFDRVIEAKLDRRKLNWGRNIQNAFARSAVMGNLSSAINQTVQLPQLTAEVGPKYVLQAITDVATGKLGEFNKESTFLTGKQGIQAVSALEGMEVLYDKLSVPFELVDDLASRIIVRSKYLQQVAQGADHATALRAADQYANRLVGSRMKGAKPIDFEDKNFAMKLITTFQLEVANGWEHIFHDLPMEIKETARTKGKAAAVGKIVRLLVAGEIAAFLANCLIKSITGREPVPFDGIGMAANYMASGYGMTKEDYMKAAITGEELPEEFDVPAAMSEAAGGVMDNIPYASNVTTLLGVTDGRLPLPQIETEELVGAGKDAMTAVFSKDEEERKAAAPRVLPQLAEGVGGTILSFAPAGNQVKKSVRGIMTLRPGGVYVGDGDDKRLKYPVEKTPGNWAKGVAFGPSALPETDAYYAEGKKTLTVNETKLYETMVKGGSDGQKVYDVMQSLKGAKERTAKVDVLLGYQGERKEKEALFSGMVTETLDEALEELATLGVPFETVLTAYKAQYGLASDKDVKTGETVPLSLAKNKKAAVDPYLRGLTRRQREAVYKALGISEKVWSLPMGLPIKAGW